VGIYSNDFWDRTLVGRGFKKGPEDTISFEGRLELRKKYEKLGK
jgi:hypothetical protein